MGDIAAGRVRVPDAGRDRVSVAELDTGGSMKWRFGGSEGGWLVAALLPELAMPTAVAAQDLRDSLEVPGGVAAASATLRIRADTKQREVVLELGPIALPTGASHQDVRQPDAQRVTLPVAGWLHGFRVEVADGQGRPIDRTVLHHVNVIAPGRRELFSQIMQRVAAAGHETPPVELPRMLGYPVEEGDTLLVTAMLHNPTRRPYTDVFLRVRMPYTPADTWLPPLSVQPFYLDVMPPASGHAYDLPPGQSTRSWEGSPAVSGRILGMGSHLHRYGVALLLEDVTEGAVLWEAEPILDAHGDVVGMPTETFFWHLGIPIRPDHVYRLTAIYENPTGETIPLGAMGALGGIVLPGWGEVWPAADRGDPEYRLDVRLVTEGAYGDESMGHGHGTAEGHGGR